MAHYNRQYSISKEVNFFIKLHGFILASKFTQIIPLLLLLRFQKKLGPANAWEFTLNNQFYHFIDDGCFKRCFTCNLTINI